MTAEEGQKPLCLPPEERLGITISQGGGLTPKREEGSLPGRLAQSAVVLQSRTLAPFLQLKVVLVLSFCFALL